MVRKKRPHPLKDKILTIKTAVTNENDVIVKAPVFKTQDVEIAGLVPNTTGMKDAINTSINEMLKNSRIHATKPFLMTYTIIERHEQNS